MNYCVGWDRVSEHPARNAVDRCAHAVPLDETGAASGSAACGARLHTEIWIVESHGLRSQLNGTVYPDPELAWHAASTGPGRFVPRCHKCLIAVPLPTDTPDQPLFSPVPPD